MSIEQTRKQIDVMLAYVNGKKIVGRPVGNDRLPLNEIQDPIWNWHQVHYEVKQNWYENIPKGGVLCWVWDDEYTDNSTVARITDYCNEDSFCFIEKDETSWRYARPLTKSEIQQLLDNAPGDCDGT